MSQASFQKRMREKARDDKARAKRQRKQERAEASEVADGDDGTPVPPQPEVLAELAELHERFADDRIDFDEFEQRRHELLAQLDV